ncbi:MAG: hypothetical protein H6832_09380 [Planctomycetes bacterium]|nr:hypothetical protein [Planctomycetota bacterium]
MKKVSFAGKPSSKPLHANVDDWVSDREKAAREPTKRLTIDVPISLHKRIKSSCALQNLVMADVVRDLLEQGFPEHDADKRAGEGNRVYDES